MSSSQGDEDEFGRAPPPATPTSSAAPAASEAAPAADDDELAEAVLNHSDEIAEL